MMTKDDISKLLSSTKSSERRKAAREVGKQNMIELGDALFNAYSVEQKDNRTWETKVDMIIALGLINYQNILPAIEHIIHINKPHDMITYAAAQTYVRLKRTSINDGKPVIELLKFGGLSLVDGALTPLGYDRMIPPQDQISEIITLSWDLHKHKDRIGHENGYLDPRYGLVAACAGWDKQLTVSFLNHCLATTTKDTSLKIIAENALKGKYSKLR